MKMAGLKLSLMRSMWTAWWVFAVVDHVVQYSAVNSAMQCPLEQALEITGHG